MEIARRLQGTGEYYFSKKLREIEDLSKEGKDIINLGIGSPDLPPHPDVIRILQDEASNPSNHAYQGYKGSPVLRNAIAAWYREWYGVNLDPATEILPLMGSKEGIMHICMTYLSEGDQVLVPNPGYPTYSSAVTLAGGICIDYLLKEENNWFPDFEAMEARDLRNTKLMFVNYPHMPTGQLPTRELFEKLVVFARKHHILIVHDNPYSFILNNRPISLLAVEGAKGTVIELNSLSKSHNMAGWRVGMLCGAKERIEEVLRFKSNMDSGMFLPVQLAAAGALGLGHEWYEQVNSVYIARKKKLTGLLELLGCSFDEKQAGMFLWAGIPKGYKDGYELSDELLHGSNVFITPGGIFGTAGARYIRISLCTKEERIEEAIMRISNKKK